MLLARLAVDRDGPYAAQRGKEGEKESVDGHYSMDRDRDRVYGEGWREKGCSLSLLRHYVCVAHRQGQAKGHANACSKTLTLRPGSSGCQDHVRRSCAECGCRPRLHLRARLVASINDRASRRQRRVEGRDGAPWRATAKRFSSVLATIFLPSAFIQP